MEHDRIFMSAMTSYLFSLFFWKMGKIQSPVPRPQTPPIPFGTNILNRLDMRIHKVPSKIYHTYKEKLSKWRLSAKLFFFCW